MNSWMVELKQTTLHFGVQYLTWYTCGSTIPLSVYLYRYYLNAENQCNIKSIQFHILTWRYGLPSCSSSIWFFDWRSFSNSMLANICTKSKLHSKCCSCCYRPLPPSPKNRANFQWSCINWFNNEHFIKSYTLSLLDKKEYLNNFVRLFLALSLVLILISIFNK